MRQKGATATHAEATDRAKQAGSVAPTPSRLPAMPSSASRLSAPAAGSPLAAPSCCCSCRMSSRASKDAATRCNVWLSGACTRHTCHMPNGGA
jgi:hypothetical protein